MSEAPAAAAAAWKLYRFGLLVTGRGEERFLDRLFRSLCDQVQGLGRGTCVFTVVAKIEQLSPRTSAKRKLTPPGQKKALPTRDEESALRALGFLRHGGDFVLFVDDLEGGRRDAAMAVFARYRTALDTVLPLELRPRAAVHFLVNMLEAYYFADAKAVNAVLSADWTDHETDVEQIGHPKGLMRARFEGFDEIEHGERILRELDVPHVLVPCSGGAGVRPASRPAMSTDSRTVAIST